MAFDCEFIFKLVYHSGLFLMVRLTLYAICHPFIISLVLFRNPSKVFVSVEMTSSVPIILHKAASLT